MKDFILKFNGRTLNAIGSIHPITTRMQGFDKAEIEEKLNKSFQDISDLRFIYPTLMVGATKIN